MRRGTHTASPTAVGTLSLGRLTSQNSLCVSPSGWATRETEIWRPLEAGNKRSGGHQVLTTRRCHFPAGLWV